MPHIHNIIDTDSHFYIDPITRSVTTKSDKLYVVQYDHDSEQFTFQVPRYVEEHDMSQCTRIEIHFTNITRNKREQIDGVYYVRADDVSSDLNTTFFKWLISRDATQLVGSLKFTITFICVDEDENVSYQWSTGMFESIEVLTKLEHTATVVKAYPDLYTKLKQDIINSIPSTEVDPTEIERIVVEYLEANPPTSSGSGKDGFSPIVTITEIEGGHEVSIEDVDGVKSFAVLNGTDGYTPVKGEDYFTEEDISEVARRAAELVESNQIPIDQVTPEMVVFPNGATTTYAIGKVILTNGSGTLVEPGGTLADFFNNFIDEKNPVTTQPSVSLTFTQGKAHEVGSTVTPVYTATFNPGKYTYGPSTGVVATSWEVTDNVGNSSENPSGSFAEVTVTDELNYVISAKVTHTAGAIPVTNTGKEYPSGQIQAGEKTASASVSMTGCRCSFYGSLEIKEEVNSDMVRSLPVKTDKALVNGDSFTIDFPVGATRAVFAYPATLRDVTSVNDVNGLNANITSSFKMELVDVAGANNYNPISYKVYVLDFAKANDTANQFTVTI